MHKNLSRFVLFLFDFQAYISEGLAPHTSCPSSGFSSTVSVLSSLIGFPCSLLTYPSLCVEVSVLPFCPSSPCVCLEVLFLCLPDGSCFVLDLFFFLLFCLRPVTIAFTSVIMFSQTKSVTSLLCPLSIDSLFFAKEAFLALKAFLDSWLALTDFS